MWVKIRKKVFYLLYFVVLCLVVGLFSLEGSEFVDLFFIILLLYWFLNNDNGVFFFFFLFSLFLVVFIIGFVVVVFCRGIYLGVVLCLFLLLLCDLIVFVELMDLEEFFLEFVNLNRKFSGKFFFCFLVFFFIGMFGGLFLVVLVCDFVF